MTRVCLLFSLVGVVLVWAHTHSNEPAHYKYSQAANEAVYEEEAHGHAHDHHGHSHDEEEHGHAHGHHGHAHEGGECPYARAAREEREALAAAAAAKNAHGHAHEGGECPHARAAREEREALAAKNAHGHAHEGGECPHARAAREAAAAKKVHAHAESTEKQFTGFLSFLNDAKTRLWVYAIGSTLLISIAPFIILFFIPISSNTAESGPLLKVLLAFGSGGLLGDAFLHLIPHATPAGDGHGHSHAAHGHSHGEGGHSHDMSVGGGVLAGIIVFLLVEKFVRIVRGEGGHGHSHGPAPAQKKDKQSDDESEKKKDKKEKKDDGKKCVEKKKEENIKVAAYLNLVADFAHNFTDGLAIGASFLAGSTVGFITMITVLVHEVPHEIGDFAILIQSGYTRRKAMCMQLVTAAGALSGCVLSLLSADGSLSDAAASSAILPFTAGGFIYIATVSVIPELLENSSLWQTIKETIALLLGIFLMYLIAVYE